MSSAEPEVFGPYLVYEQLGTGGMAEVHRAEQRGIEGFSKAVALKRMLPHVAANPEMVRAFVREARLASHLRHANVAQTYELGKVGDIYFIAMELIEGRNLREVLRVCATLGTWIPVPIALHLVVQIADALDYAHNLSDDDGQPLGLIHRDVSPSNVIVAEGGVVKLIDFGIAKASAAGMQTMGGMIKGKFGYMAPEYIAGTIDARADLFAAGVVAHELLTNRPLFTVRDDLQTLHRVRSLTIEPPSGVNPGVPPEIDDIILIALARDPQQRWQTGHALRTAIATVTKRLGLDTTSQEVVEWLDRTLVEMPTRPLYIGVDAGAGSHEISVDDARQALGVSHPPAAEDTSSFQGVIEPPTWQSPGVVADLDPAWTAHAANVHHAIRERTSAPPIDDARHAALVPSQSFLSDDIVPTLVRGSDPSLRPPPHPAAMPARAPSQPAVMPAPRMQSSPSIVPGPAPATPLPSPARAHLAPTTSAADRASATSVNPGRSRATAVALVVVTAVAAAATVYFVLPLLT